MNDSAFAILVFAGALPVILVVLYAALSFFMDVLSDRERRFNGPGDRKNT